MKVVEVDMKDLNLNIEVDTKHLDNIEAEVDMKGLKLDVEAEVEVDMKDLNLNIYMDFYLTFFT